MADLDKLIEAVEGGVFLVDVFPHEVIAYKAFSGSLDAAKSLHEALLPGWRWEVSDDDESDAAIVWPSGRISQNISGGSIAPSRAWLLAILKAYRSTL